MSVRDIDPSAAGKVQHADPFVVPTWVQQLLFLIVVVVAVLAFYLLSKTNFRLKVREHRQIQQIVVTVVATVTVMVIVQGLGIELLPSLVVATVFGATSHPGGQYCTSRLDIGSCPRSTLLAGWVLVLIVMSFLPGIIGMFELGRGGTYASIAIGCTVFAASGDSLALLRELASQD